MKKIKYILKAAVILGIVFAFVVPVNAMIEKTQPEITRELPYNKLFKTLNLNPGWVEQASGFWEASRGIRYMDAVNETIAWAVGYDGSGGNIYQTIFTKTINGGDLWQADLIFSDINYGLGNICALDGETAWAAVFATGTQDDKCGIYKTINGGYSWVHQFLGPYSFANNVWFFNENEGVCCGDLLDNYFEVYTTSNGGTTWNRVPLTNFSGVSVATDEAGWTGCIDGFGDTVLFGSNKGKVFKSDDKGHTWVGSDTGMGASGLNPGVNEIAFKDINNGLVAHDNGITYDLYKTDNGGTNWQPVTYTGIAYSAGLSYVPGTANTYISTGAVSGTSGASYSIDGGITWVDYPEVLGIQLLSCEFVEGGIGWAGSFNEDELNGGMYKYIPGEEPDLECTGNLVWQEVKAGSTVYGEFTVSNIGTGLLNWEVDTKPEWGTWTFNPENGELSGSDSVIVNVTLVAPQKKKSEFTGTIKIINSDDPTDFCEIDASLTTPRARTINGFNLLQWILQKYPNMFPIIRSIFA